MGANDIQKLADRGTLKGLSVTMKFFADALRLKGALKDKLDAIVAPLLDRGVAQDGATKSWHQWHLNNVNTHCKSSFGWSYQDSTKPTPNCSSST